MALEENERIIIPDENGDEHLFEVLYIFEVDDLEASYVAVVPVEQAEDEEVEVYAFRYEEKEDDDEGLTLFPIETDEEWDIIEATINTLVEEDDE